MALLGINQRCPSWTCSKMWMMYEWRHIGNCGLHFCEYNLLGLLTDDIPSASRSLAVVQLLPQVKLQVHGDYRERYQT